MRETPEVFYRGTEAYRKRVAALDLSEEEDREQVFRFLVEQQKAVPVGDHHIVVGDCYVFSAPDKLGIPLGGYYVNVHTGEVCLREARGRIPFRKQ
jgi:hypothetical protein